MVEWHSLAPSHYSLFHRESSGSDVLAMLVNLHEHCTTAHIITPYPNSTSYISTCKWTCTQLPQIPVCIHVLDLTLAYGLKRTAPARPTARNSIHSQKNTCTNFNYDHQFPYTATSHPQHKQNSPKTRHDKKRKEVAHLGHLPLHFPFRWPILPSFS